MDNLWMLFAAAGVMAAVIVTLSLLSDHYTLNNIKSKTVGDGQHGTARWATDAEIRKTYALVLFRVSDWRMGKNLPDAQGLVLGSISGKHGITALVDKDDVIRSGGLRQQQQLVRTGRGCSLSAADHGVREAGLFDPDTL